MPPQFKREHNGTSNKSVVYAFMQNERRVVEKYFFTNELNFMQLLSGKKHFPIVIRANRVKRVITMAHC